MNILIYFIHRKLQSEENYKSH